MNPRSKLKYGISVFLLEVFLLGLWVYNLKPDPSISIAIILIVPILFILNLIIGFTLYYLKKPLFKLFLVNSIICPLIFYAFWNLWFMNYHERNNTVYKFALKNTVYELSIGKNDNYFYLSDENDNGRVYVGKYENLEDSIILNDPEVKMYITNGKLYKFPEQKTGIKLIKTNKTPNKE